MSSKNHSCREPASYKEELKQKRENSLSTATCPLSSIIFFYLYNKETQEKGEERKRKLQSFSKKNIADWGFKVISNVGKAESAGKVLFWMGMFIDFVAMKVQSSELGDAGVHSNSLWKQSTGAKHNKPNKGYFISLKVAVEQTTLLWCIVEPINIKRKSRNFRQQHFQFST